MLSRGAGPQWDVPQAIGAVVQVIDYYMVLFQVFYIKFGKDGITFVIAELPHGDEGARFDVVEDMGGL